jgi:hypothetical protein
MQQMQIERERIQTQAQLESAKTAVHIQQEKEKMGIELTKHAADHLHEQTKQHKDLMVKGLDNAFRHGNAAQQQELTMNQPKQKAKGK